MIETQAQVAIITDDPGWHGQQLCNALKARGFGSRYVSLTECLIEIDSGNEKLCLPGFANLPAAVFVRGIASGSLEQIIFRLNILHALHTLHQIKVYNSPKAIERTVDKPLTSLLLNRAGIATPATWMCESITHARTILDKQTRGGKKLVQKPLFGSQGIGAHLVDGQTGLIHDETFAGVYYLQRFVERPNNEYTDIRVLVADGLAKAAMLRRGQNWLTNRAQGAHCEAFKLNPEIASLAETACKILAIDYAGVDIMQDQTGQFLIIEVNSVPAWYGLQQHVDFNIADCLIDSLIGHINQNQSLKTI